MTLELVYFYMHGCPWCVRFDPIWMELQKILDKVNFYKFESDEVNNSDKAKEIVKSYGDTPSGYPTILVKVNDKYERFLNEERTVKNIINFMMKYIKKTDESYKYLEDKLKENNLEISQKRTSQRETSQKQTSEKIKSSNKQHGGNKNVDYRHKYKKYKKMYAELLEKYTELKKS